MTRVLSVNSFVRRKVRQLRISRGFSLKDVSFALDMPISSYAALEYGECRFPLDVLYQVLGILEAEITDVWPLPTGHCDGEPGRFRLQRIQQFRLHELIELSDAEGGVLFAEKGGSFEVLLSDGLSDSTVERICLYTRSPGGSLSPGGIRIERRNGRRDFHLYLQAEPNTRLSLVKNLAELYLSIWVEFYSSPRDGSPAG